MAAVREHVWPLIEAGRVRPVVARARSRWRQPPTPTGELEASAHIGKVLLTP